jgi:hypothetical protein
MKWTPTRFGEYCCEHGVGHPSLARGMSLAKYQMVDGKDITKDFCKRQLGACMVHGCDGCCSLDDFPGRFSQEEYDAAIETLMKFYTTKKSQSNAKT